MSARVRVGQLGAAHASVEEQTDDGGVAPVGEPASRAGRQEPAHVLELKDRYGFLGYLGAAHALHG
jgi:hypothetical protein